MLKGLSPAGDSRIAATITVSRYRKLWVLKVDMQLPFSRHITLSFASSYAPWNWIFAHHPLIGGSPDDSDVADVADFHLTSLSSWFSNTPCNLCNSRRQLTYSDAFVWPFVAFFIFFAEVVPLVLFLLDFAISLQSPYWRNSYLRLKYSKWVVLSPYFCNCWSNRMLSSIKNRCFSMIIFGRNPVCVGCNRIRDPKIAQFE